MFLQSRYGRNAQEVTLSGVGKGIYNVGKKLAIFCKIPHPGVMSREMNCNAMISLGVLVHVCIIQGKASTSTIQD